MGQRRIGAAVSGHDSAVVIAEIKKLEEIGIQDAWLTTALASGLETMALFAAAALCTKSIMQGTSITLKFPTHHNSGKAGDWNRSVNAWAFPPRGWAW